MRNFLLVVAVLLASYSATSQTMIDLRKGHEPKIARFTYGSYIEVKMKKDDFYISGPIGYISQDYMDVNGFKVIYSEIDYIVYRKSGLTFWGTAFLYAGLGALILPPVNNLILSHRPLIAEEFATAGAVMTLTGVSFLLFAKKKYYIGEEYNLKIMISEE